MLAHTHYDVTCMHMQRWGKGKHVDELGLWQTIITDTINIKLKHQCRRIRCWNPNMPDAAKSASSHEARTKNSGRKRRR